MIFACQVETFVRMWHKIRFKWIYTKLFKGIKIEVGHVLNVNIVFSETFTVFDTQLVALFIPITKQLSMLNCHYISCILLIAH